MQKALPLHPAPADRTSHPEFVSRNPGESSYVSHVLRTYEDTHRLLLDLCHPPVELRVVVGRLAAGLDGVSGEDALIRLLLDRREVPRPRDSLRAAPIIAPRSHSAYSLA